MTTNYWQRRLKRLRAGVIQKLYWICNLLTGNIPASVLCKLSIVIVKQPLTIVNCPVNYLLFCCCFLGWVPERLNGSACKAVDFVGSNPTPSSNFLWWYSSVGLEQVFHTHKVSGSTPLITTIKYGDVEKFGKLDGFKIHCFGLSVRVRPSLP